MLLLLLGAGSWLPAHASTFQNGVMFLRAGRCADAESALARAMEEPDAPGDYALWFLALARENCGDTDGALASFRTLAADRMSALALEASLRAAELYASRGEAYAGVSMLLPWADDDRRGPRAAYHAGRIALESGDTEDAERIWSELFTLHPGSSFAHKAVLREMALHNALTEIDDYTLLSMARSAAAAADFLTAQDILESMERRAIDRRLRDDVLLLHGETLFRLSRYEEALATFREARMMTLGRAEEQKAELGIALSMLHLGDTPYPSSIARLRRGDSSVLDALETIAALRRARGDRSGAQALLEMLDRPTLTEFLLALDEAFPESAPAAASAPLAGDTRSAWRDALAAAERLTDPSDRGLAAAILAERASDNAVDFWRTVLMEAEDAWLARLAAARIEQLDTGAEALTPGTLASEAAQNAEAQALYDAALRALTDGRTGPATRELRVARYGYRGTPASRSATEFLRGWAAKEFPVAAAGASATARMLEEAGAWKEAAEALEGSSEPRDVGLRADALAQSGQWTDAIGSLEELIARTGRPVATDDLAESLQEILYPLPYREALERAADSYGVDPAILAALCRAQTRFDPAYHEGYRLGITGVDIEAVAFARQFADAPALAGPEELLIPEKALAFSAWYVKFLGASFGETEPGRIAALLEAGPANRSEAAAGSEAEEIARLPFRSARRFVMDFLEAYDRYHARFPARAKAGAPARVKPIAPARPRPAPPHVAPKARGPQARPR